MNEINEETNDEINDKTNQIKPKYTNVDLKKLLEIAQKYGFNNVVEFSEWVEDNNLGEILFGKDLEDIEREENEKRERRELGKEEKTKKLDKDSITYKSTILALDILSLPEVKRENLGNISFDQWLKWSRKAKAKNKTKTDDGKI